MAEETKDEHKSENNAGGGETDKKETTGKTSEELAKIATDQRKRAEIAEGKLKEKEDAEKVVADKAKADADAKKAEENKNNNISAPTDPVELAKMANVLKDMSDKEIEELQAVAKAKNLSLAAAKNDPLFQAWHTKFLEDAKKERNKMGGSRGSDQAGDENEPIAKSGMSRDDHIKLVKDLSGAK